MPNSPAIAGHLLSPALSSAPSGGEGDGALLVFPALLPQSDIPSRHAPLRRVNLNLEKLRIFWRLICDRRWISALQLLFVSQRLDEIGRMIGGWLKTLPKN